MLRVALTGGIGTGKTHVLNRLAAAGVPVVDADRIVHDLMRPAAPVFAAVVARFGRDLVQPDGTLDRRRLGAKVFADEAARRDLEAIVHPAVYQAVSDWLDATARSGAHALAVADIPLLYETGREREFDRVIVTICPPACQVARVTARDGVTEADVRARMAAQWPVEEKARRADFVIRTEGTIAETDRQVDAVLAAMEEGTEPRAPSPEP